MRYTSTRDNRINITSAQAILGGISPEGGLFVPTKLPLLTRERLEALTAMDYTARAKEIMGAFLTDYPAELLASCCQQAYQNGRFDDENPAPLARLAPGLFLLELWHGPTCAFKDMALQILPHLMTGAAALTGETREILVLVATSGDTGKAALEGFADVPGVKILVYYPQDGVSHMQKLQMITQQGENVAVCGIQGNFDDAQRGVKALFTDPGIIRTLDQRGAIFSSANSINWGRLLPQIVYYVSAYCDLAGTGEIALGQPVNIAVPTGNFGNILAAYYAGEMGLPVARLICASNRNNVLTDFIRTGCYDRNRPFYPTLSPSMDILVSSNLERLLYDLYDRDDQAVSALMKELGEKGSYRLPRSIAGRLGERFWAGCCDDGGTKAAIQSVFNDYSYLLDTHTAVAMSVYRDYVKETGDATPTLVVSTANPYKFPQSVLSAVEGDVSGDEFEAAARLEAVSGCPMPSPLAGLGEKPVRFPHICAPEEMGQAAQNMLP